MSEHWHVADIIRYAHMNIFTDWEECLLDENEIKDLIYRVKDKIKLYSDNNSSEFINCFGDLVLNMVCSQLCLSDNLTDDEIDFIAYAVYSIMTCGNLVKTDINWSEE
jgi:hypothetical protein